MQDRQPIVEVSLPQAAQNHIKGGNLDAALAPQNFRGQEKPMEEVTALVAKLIPVQRQLLLDGLAHSLRDSHGGRVSFSKRAVGYELDAVQLSVTDATVTEDGTIAPIAITFAYKG